MATRTVAVSFPDGEKEYWLTDQMFAIGETISRNGHEWTVAAVLDPAHTGSHLAVRLRKPIRVDSTKSG